MRGVAGLVLATAALAALVAWLAREPERIEPEASLPLTGLLGAAADPAFLRADTPGAIRLPADHGPHPRFQTEWWYFTGSLADQDGREFGFQLTFFRYAVSADEPDPESSWATGQVYMAHFAITDRAGGQHRVAERLAREAVGLAGAAATPFVVWLDDWSARSSGPGFLPLRLSAADPDTGIALELDLQPGRPAVLQGDRGLSAKGEAPGNASYYYSFTRLPVAGTLRVDGRVHRVAGQAWLDREWGTSALEPGTVGWDWLGLQLDDGRDVMIYALRDASGRPQPASAGRVILPDGASRRLGRDDFSLRPLRWWTSPATGIEWPIAWTLAVPSERLGLEVAAVVDDQEQALSVVYWEGAVDAGPAGGGGGRLGRGYLEMTGYAPPRQPSSAR